jgi:hypothetical protein
MFKAWKWGTYIFFAVFLLGGIVWVWFCLPETKGVTLEEMDRVFKSHSGAEDAEILAEVRREIGMMRNSEEKGVEGLKDADAKVVMAETV